MSGNALQISIYMKAWHQADEDNGNFLSKLRDTQEKLSGLHDEQQDRHSLPKRPVAFGHLKMSSDPGKLTNRRPPNRCAPQ